VNIATVDPTKNIQTNAFVEMSITFKVYQDLNMKSRTFFVVEQDIGLPIIGHYELAELGVILYLLWNDLLKLLCGGRRIEKHGC
jgi:hypothetical protein